MRFTCSIPWQTCTYLRTWQHQMTTIKQPFQCNLKPEIQKPHRTTHTDTTTRCKTHRRNNYETTALRLPNSPLAFVTASLPHHFPSSPPRFVTTSLPHHFPSSPLPFLTTSHRHHLPSSPPCVIASLFYVIYHHSSRSTPPLLILLLCIVMLCIVM